MSRDFAHATAEQVVNSIECTMLYSDGVSAATVASFLEIPEDVAKRALMAAKQIGALAVDPSSGHFIVGNPFSRFFVFGDHKRKSVLFRLFLESYDIFLFFRDRLDATSSADTAAKNTKSRFGITAHYEEIKGALLDWATYSQALVSEGANQYKMDTTIRQHPIEALLPLASDSATIRTKVIEMLDDAFSACSDRDVIVPLVTGLGYALSGNSRESIMNSGNAVESFLVILGNEIGANLSGATGIYSKIEKISATKAVPKKLKDMAKFVGSMRNAADHGTDSDIHASWEFFGRAGSEYSSCAISLIVSLHRWNKGTGFVL